MAENANRFGYERVIAGILRMIKDQGMAEGSKLPTLPELQERFDVSSTTARRAVDDLKRRGVIHGRQGSGNYVADPAKVAEVEADKDEELRAAVDGFREDLRTIGLRLAQVEEQLQQLRPRPDAAEGPPQRRPTRRPAQ
jgi:GntR family transcriptional regulator